MSISWTWNKYILKEVWEWKSRNKVKLRQGVWIYPGKRDRIQVIYWRQNDPVIYVMVDTRRTLNISVTLVGNSFSLRFMCSAKLPKWENLNYIMIILLRLCKVELNISGKGIKRSFRYSHFVLIVIQCILSTGWEWFFF